MSSCLILYQNDKLYMSADTAACLKDENGYSRIANNAEKIKVIGNAIVFTAGNLELCRLVFDYLETYKDAHNSPYLLSSYLQQQFLDVAQYDLEVMIGTIFENKVRIYQISSYEDFDVMVYEGSKDSVGVLASGSNNDELNEYVSRNFDSDIKNLYRKAYQSINNEIVGGDMLLYYMDIYGTKSPKMIDRFTIDDYVNKKYMSKTNVHYVLAKNLVGQMILGNSLGIYSEDSKMQLNFDNHGLVINAKKGDDNTYRRIFDIQKDGKSQLYCDSDGNIVLATNQIIQMGNKLDRVVTDYADIENLYVKNATLETLLTKYAKIENLEAFKADFKKLVADEAQIKELEAGNVTIAGLLKSQNAEIENIKATKIEVSDLEAYKATIEKLLASYATIKQLEADYIKAKDIEANYAKISVLEANYATIEKLNTATAEINKLIAKKASIEDLNAVNATIKTLNVDLANVKKLVATKVNADYVQAEIVKANKVITDDLQAIHGVIDQLDTKYATIEQLKAQRAELDNLIAKKATTEELNTAKATIGQLDAQLANINSILAGNIGTGTLQTVHLTAENVVIDEAVVRDLIAAKINVNDLKAGNISTDRFTIKSDDGGVVIKGSTQQFLDKDGRVRVQIGKDAKGNFNFLVMGADGKTTLYDQDGIKASGVPDGLIVDKMVADNANIQASKVKYIDKDGNTTLQTVIDNQQGKISSLIKETTIDNGDGTTTSLKDAYNQTVQTVEGNKTTIANVKTSVDNVSGKVTKMESSITEIKHTADGITTTVTANKDKWDKASSDASNALNNSTQAKKDAENALNKAQDVVNKVESGELDGQDAIMLYIDSSNGTTFKNSSVATIFTVTIYVGSTIIDNSTKLRQMYGDGAYLQWLIKKHGEKDFTKIPLDDPRLNDNGFIFTITAKDVKFKAVFNCELNI